MATVNHATATIRARFLALCASLVVAAHVSALSWNSEARAPSGTSSGTTAIDVLWVRDAVREGIPSSATAETPATAALKGEHQEVAADIRPQQITSPAPSVKPTAAAPLPTTEGSPPIGDALEYLPRAKLTLAPAPLQPIEIPFPASVDNPLHFRGQLSLFIDEHGQVQRIRVDGPAMPWVLEEAARNAFLRARFTPGEVDGRAVRSLIRIEVDFEAEVRSDERS